MTTSMRYSGGRKRTRKSPPRKGRTAICGGTADVLMPTIYVCAVRPKRQKPPHVCDPRPLAEIFAPHPGNDMYQMREDMAARINKRTQQSRADRKKWAKRS